MTGFTAAPVPLAHTELGSGEPVVILHGLFGQGRNWRAVARWLADRGCRAICPDLRNHGASPAATPMDYPAMAADVEALRRRLGIDRFALIGHSMGGKVAMHYALTAPERLRALVVVDIAPVTYPDRYSALVDALLALDLDAIGARSQADRQLAPAIPDSTLRGFLLQNLRRDAASGWHWAANLRGLREALPAILDFPPPAPGQRFEGPTLVVRGGRSEAVTPGHVALMREWFPALAGECIEAAGHWPHHETPEAFMQALERFLAGVPAASDEQRSTQ